MHMAVETILPPNERLMRIFFTGYHFSPAILTADKRITDQNRQEDIPPCRLERIRHG